MRHLWLAAYDTLLATQMLKLSLAVAKGAAHREPAWEDTVWTHERIVFVVAVLRGRASLLADLLGLSGRHALVHHCLRLVDMATGRFNPRKLHRIRGLVVPGEDTDLAGRLHADLGH